MFETSSSLLIAAFSCGFLLEQVLCAGGKGMTWSSVSHQPSYGIDYVGCGTCNAYQGDTVCTNKLSILCVNIDKSPRPCYSVPATCGGVMPCHFYHGWLGGHVAITAPVVGTLLTSKADGDARCAALHGVGWAMAEHHLGRYISGMNETARCECGTLRSTIWSDGLAQNGGWNFYAYGNVPKAGRRYWVAINNQAANCWDP